MALLEGKILDHYELRRLVGKGGTANVYEAFDIQMHQKVAVKVFKRENEEMLRRFIREARVMASLRHEHLVPIIDSGQYQLHNDIRYYIVMPFFDEGTLRARIRRSSLSSQETCQSLRSIGRALDYVHSQGIIHRDIKASNILLNSDGEVYLTDFGVARVANDATQLTSTGDVLGTADYVAPELFEEHRRADARSDLYSLGVLLYEMVTGRLPFTAESQLVVVSMHMNKKPPSPRSIVPTISLRIERVLYKALEKRAEQRYANATELAEAFCNAVTSSRKGKAVESGNEPKVEQGEIAVLPEVTIESIKSSVAPVATIGASSSSSPLVNAGVSHQFKSPQPGFKIAPVQPELSLNPLTPSPTQEDFRHPNRNRWIAVFLAFLALMMLVTSVVSIVLQRTNNEHTITPTAPQISSKATVELQKNIPTATPNLTATAMAVQAATATARVQETASVIAAMTVTAEAKASATAGVILTATSGKPVYLDTLNNANSANTMEANWDQNSKCFFGTTIPLKNWTSSPALRQGYAASNTLQVIVQGNSLSLYANDVFLVQLSDSTYTSGLIAFFATTDGIKEADVVYGNLKVYPIV